jgi:hypothetical protein
VGSEIPIQGGYSAGGRTLTNVVWTLQGDPGSVMWDATDLVFHGKRRKSDEYQVRCDPHVSECSHVGLPDVLVETQYKSIFGNYG